MPASLSVYPQIVQQIRPRAKGILALSHRLADFPGLKDSLALIAGLELRWLDENAAARGALAKPGVFAEEPDAQNVTFLTSLPLSSKPSGGNASAADDLLPTHLLYRARAYPLGQGSLVLGADPKATPSDWVTPLISPATASLARPSACPIPRTVPINPTDGMAHARYRTMDNSVSIRSYSVSQIIFTAVETS